MTLSIIAFVLCAVSAILNAAMGHIVRCAFMFLLALGNLLFIFNDLDSGRRA